PAWHALSAFRQDVLYYQCVDGESLADIALLLGRTERWIRAQQLAAMDALRRELWTTTDTPRSYAAPRPRPDGPLSPQQALQRRRAYERAWYRQHVGRPVRPYRRRAG